MHKRRAHDRTTRDIALLVLANTMVPYECGKLSTVRFVLYTMQPLAPVVFKLESADMRHIW
jgi:hypothetical protein